MTVLDACSPTAHVIISQRLRLHYADWGNHEAPPLLLIHGGADHCRNWDPVAEALRQDWHVMAPDLRGHGDSAWSPSGDYSMAAYVYDLAQIVHQKSLAPVSIIGHSLGGNIATRYAGLYPEAVRRLVVIEGLGPSPAVLAERDETGMPQRMRDWIAEQRSLASRLPRRYARFEDAVERMRQQNAHLTPALAEHLTRHGVSQNEDGSYSWKFDNYTRLQPPADFTPEQIHQLWSRIACPVLLAYGQDSWASNPARDGRMTHFAAARLEVIEEAGHWIHHDQLAAFLALARGFLTDAAS